MGFLSTLATSSEVSMQASKPSHSPKDGAQRKREHDARKREAGLKEFRAWVTPDEAKQLREFLARIREI